jgi:hypothetical protein
MQCTKAHLPSLWRMTLLQRSSHCALSLDFVGLLERDVFVVDFAFTVFLDFFEFLQRDDFGVFIGFLAPLWREKLYRIAVRAVTGHTKASEAWGYSSAATTCAYLVWLIIKTLLAKQDFGF